jgi:HAD superfamily hydrolase (TIGR01549 family)
MTMIEAVLFDLDDTLLGNSMEQFIPRYFSLLSKHALPLFSDRKRFLQELLYGTQAMIKDTDPSLTNREVFWRVFVERTGLDVEEAEAFFNGFYIDGFLQLQEVTEQRPAAIEAVKLCFECELTVAIATNPLFPASAIEHRLAWAGLPVSDFNYALVTSYENMHATKPHQAYYREILEAIGATAEKAVMVGDNWENDIVPAAALGMKTFWITPAGEPPRSATQPTAYGTIDEFYQWLKGQLPS